MLSMLIFTLGSTWGQNNPYQAECSKLGISATAQCAQYSNCRLIGGSSDDCIMKTEATINRPVTSIKESMDKQASTKATHEKRIEYEQQKRYQEDWQRQQQIQQQYQLQQQYQQNKK